MDVPLASGGRLTAAEIGDLADEFPTPELASRVLEAAGLPPGRHPRWQVGTARQFWNEVANLIAHGALADGRANLVAAVAAARLEGLFDTTPSTWDLPSPASLLRPSWGAVEFYGRTEELSLLERWCEEDDGSPVRLVVGPGGQGKTRLGLRLCAAWRARGWDAGLLSPSAGAVAMDAAAVSERPLLVVVDYAEARQVQLGLLLERLVRRRSRRRRRRILLLARSASDDSQWWASLRARYPDVCATVVPEPLPPLDPESADRAGSYRQVLTDLAEAWRAVSRDVDWPGLATRLVVPDDLSESTYELALALQTRALTDLLQAGPDPAEGTGPGREFADVLLDHERRYWADSAGARGLAPLPYPMSLLGRAVAAAALCGAADERQAVATLCRLPVLEGESRLAVLALAEWLRDLYPASPGSYWGTLAPDLVAEHHVAVTLRASPELAEALLAKAADDQLVRGLVVLARATAHQPRLPARLAELLADRSAITVAVERLDVSALATVVDALPERSVELAEAGATMTTLALSRLRTDGQDRDVILGTRVRLLNTLSARLADLGRRDDALAAVEEAVSGLRVLTKALPRASPAALATTLNNLSLRLADAGREDEALSAVEEAVQLHRQLVRSGPGAVRLDLARTLNNLSLRLADAGREDEALSAVEEAVQLHRQLVRSDPCATRSELARSLSNLSLHLVDVDRSSEALSAAEEAVTIRRSLARARPDAYNPDLALSLSVLSVVLARLDRGEEALHANSESVELYRQLIQTCPNAFLHNLAASLNSLRDQLVDLGRHEDALTPGEEAVVLYRRLVRSSPAKFGALLVASLRSRGDHLDRLGLWEESLAVTEEAVEVSRALTETRPDVFRADLASSLGALAGRLLNLGRHEEAIVPGEEAVAICRHLAEKDPESFSHQLAASLKNLSIHLASLSQHQRALAAVQEAVRICRPLAKTRPDTAAPVLANALNNFSNRLATLGRRKKALAAAREAVDLCRTLAQTDLHERRHDLAMALGTLSLRLADVSRREEAMKAAEEAVRIYRDLNQDRPGPVLPPLALALNNLVAHLAELDRYEEALAAARETVAHLRELYDVHPEKFAEILSVAFLNLGNVERRSGHREEALYAFIAAALYSHVHRIHGTMSLVRPILLEERERDQRVFDKVWNILAAAKRSDDDDHLTGRVLLFEPCRIRRS